MALPIGTTAPDFSLPSTSGEIFTLSVHLKNKSGILYFYPKYFNPDCTKEACAFQDNFHVFDDRDILVFGISRDSIQLLSDVDGRVAKLYRANIPLTNLTARITYRIDPNQKIVGVYTNMLNAKAHITHMIHQLSL
ncbi:MAG: peroxiredoxin [Gemmatimonadetes bacterium]|nr:MAG: peroxiredoxin [Gemmatimonadota bacterium]